MRSDNLGILTSVKMASLAPDSCCYKGVKHEGVAKGKLSQVAGIEAYTVYPESQSTEKAILMCVFDFVFCISSCAHHTGADNSDYNLA